MKIRCFSWKTALLPMMFLLFGFRITGIVRAQPLEYGTPASFVELHGMFVQEYFDFEKDGLNAGIGSFDNRYAYLFFDCSLRKNLKGVLELKFNHGGEEIKIDRCYIDWSVHQLVNFRLGKFYLPLYDVRDVRPFGNPLVSTDLSFAIDPDIFRDNGIEAYGETSVRKIKLGYDLTFTNGTLLQKILQDENKNTLVGEGTIDRNQEKALTAKIYCFPLPALEISGSYFTTKTSVIAEIKTVNAQNQIITTRMDLGKVDMDLTLGRIDYKLERLDLNGYYLRSESQVPGGAPSKSTTWWGQADYKILKDKYVNYLQIAARYKVSESASSETVSPALGLGISPYEHFILKIEYQWKDERKGVKLDDDAILLQAVVDF